MASNPYLGVQSDSKLCWKEHIEFVVGGANKILGLIRRNFWFCDAKVKLTLYETFKVNINNWKLNIKWLTSFNSS